jgi:hypothetical protein
MRLLTTLSTLTLPICFSIAVAGCDDSPAGEELTTVSATVTSTSTGMGGDTGGGGSGGSPTTGGGGQGGTPTTGGGGEGGAPEQMIHGCLSTTATDLTGTSTININVPGGPLCARVTKDSTMTFTLDQTNGACPGNCDHRPLGGFYDDATMVKYPDAASPIQSCCDVSPFVCCPAVTATPFVLNGTGVFPWYDDKHPATNKGVVYVVD